MQKLVQGIHQFRRNYFATHRALMERLATTGQNPETLFITCSDSRVVPNLITNAAPGELFIVRNVGNVVPSPSQPGGTAAAIEYAIEVLKVQTIIVCGHTQCGAMQAVMDPDRVANLPLVRRWLGHTAHVRQIVLERYRELSGEELLTAAVEENVLVQLENLPGFSFIADRLERGELNIAGWVYRLQTGDVFSYDPSIEQFVSLAPPPK
ncbi:MAG: carbonic anhydrase [Polyangiales bacterium]